TAVEAAFEQIPESGLIDTAIEKWIRLKGKPQDREDLKRFYQHLMRRGFDYDLIKSRLSEFRTVPRDD
ncbi:MAG: RecX family transcriptional regulator, partial [Acidobacteria bacterium]|nr:RecX family transcriptional regulator [Acidobacteriota bacterium]